jgi:ribonuclease HI
MYNARKTKPSHSHEIDNALKYTDWPHPADCPKITVSEDNKEPAIQAYTYGSKGEQGVGSGAAIFIGNKLAKQMKFKLDKRCSNNQAEPLAISKALEAIDTLNTEESSPRTATIFTDSRLTIDSLRNPDNHAYLIEEIRRRVAKLQSPNWKIGFSWVKAHVGIYGNELADKLAKEAARSKHTDKVFRRIPISTLYHEIKLESTLRWQKEWENCTKAAITKQYFPTVQERLKTKIIVTRNMAAMQTWHGKTGAYLHRLKILEKATCACEQVDQTVDHILYRCTLLETQRQNMKNNAIKAGQWPRSKQHLISKHRDTFLNFMASMDFENL